MKNLIKALKTISMANVLLPHEEKPSMAITIFCLLLEEFIYIKIKQH